MRFGVIIVLYENTVFFVFGAGTKDKLKILLASRTVCMKVVVLRTSLFHMYFCIYLLLNMLLKLNLRMFLCIYVHVNLNFPPKVQDSMIAIALVLKVKGKRPGF